MPSLAPSGLSHIKLLTGGGAAARLAPGYYLCAPPAHGCSLTSLGMSIQKIPYVNAVEPALGVSCPALLGLDASTGSFDDQRMAPSNGLSNVIVDRLSNSI